MNKSKLISAVRRHLTSCEGGGMDAATAEQAVIELNNLSDFIYELHLSEQDIVARVVTEGRITSQLIKNLEIAQKLASQLARFDGEVEVVVGQPLEQLRDYFVKRAINRPLGRPKKLGPTHVVIALRAALIRARIPDNLVVGALRKTLAIIGLSASEVETALKKSRRWVAKPAELSGEKNRGFIP